MSQPDLTTPATLDTEKTYSYVDSTSSPSYIHEADYMTSTTTVDTYDYYDGLDRLIQERKSTATANLFDVDDLTYNNAGLLASQSFRISRRVLHRPLSRPQALCSPRTNTTDWIGS